MQARADFINTKITGICCLAQDFLWILPISSAESRRRSVGFYLQLGPQETR